MTRAFQIKTMRGWRRSHKRLFNRLRQTFRGQVFFHQDRCKTELFEHQGANRLFGFPAGRKRNEQRATTRPQDIADRVVTGL